MTAFNTQTCNYPRVVSVNIWLDLVSLHLGASNLCIVDGQRGRTDEPMTKLSDMTQPLRPPFFPVLGRSLGVVLSGPPLNCTTRANGQGL